MTPNPSRVAGLVALICTCAAAAGEPDLSLRYDAPAKSWVEALPIGNGRLGAMVYGGVGHERLQLNEDSMWSGSPAETDNPEALPGLKQVRELLWAGKYKEAQELANQKLRCKDGGPDTDNAAEKTFGSYQTLGDLWIETPGMENATNYSRRLDLATATAVTEWEVAGTRYKRMVFASKPSDAVIILFQSKGPGTIDFTARLDRDKRNCCKGFANNAPITASTEGERPADAITGAAHGTVVAMQGALSDGRGATNVKYAAAMTCASEGGAATVDGDLLDRKSVV